MTDRRQKREGSFGSFDSLAAVSRFIEPVPAFPQLSHVPGIRQTPVNTKQEIHVACAENTNAHVHKSTTTMIKSISETVAMDANHGDLVSGAGGKC